MSPCGISRHARHTSSNNSLFPNVLSGIPNIVATPIFRIPEAELANGAAARTDVGWNPHRAAETSDSATDSPPSSIDTDLNESLVTLDDSMSLNDSGLFAPGNYAQN